MSCHREVEKLFPNSYRRARAKIPNHIVAWMLIPRVLSCKSNEISMGLLVVLGHLLIWVKAGALKGFMSIIFKEKPLGTNRIYLKKYGTVSVERQCFLIWPCFLPGASFPARCQTHPIVGFRRHPQRRIPFQPSLRALLVSRWTCGSARFHLRYTPRRLFLRRSVRS